MKLQFKGVNPEGLSWAEWSAAARSETMLASPMKPQDRRSADERKTEGQRREEQRALSNARAMPGKGWHAGRTYDTRGPGGRARTPRTVARSA